MLNLEGKVAVVAGATRSAGRVIACALGEAFAADHQAKNSMSYRALSPLPEHSEESHCLRANFPLDASFHYSRTVRFTANSRIETYLTGINRILVFLFGSLGSCRGSGLCRGQV